MTIARRLARAVVLGAMVASLVVPAAASASPFRSAGELINRAADVRSLGFRASALDDDIPGVPLPSSLATGVIDANLDWIDVYSVDLEAGQPLSARISGPKGSDFAMILLDPSTPDINFTDIEMLLGLSLGNPGYLFGIDWINQDVGDFVAPETGTYYLLAMAIEGSGQYAIDWKLGARPATTIQSSKDIIGYHASAQISGSVVGTNSAPLAGETVELFGWKYPNFAYGTKLGSVETSTDGSYTFSVSPTTHTAYTIATVGTVEGYGIYESEEAAFIQPKVYVGPPVASSPKTRYVPFNIHGSLKPKHSAGAKSVLVKCYHLESGNWVLRKTAWATNKNYSDYTSYVLKTSLSKPGKWKFVGVAADDGYHARSQSSSSKVITVN